MKKIVTLMLIVLGITALQAKTKDPYHLILEGEFLNQKHVDYTVFMMNDEGTFISEFRDKGRKNFYILCDVGNKYIIRFQDKNRNVKFLLVDASRSGYFAVNVDFSKPYDAVIKDTKSGYSLTPIVDTKIKANLIVKN